MDMSSVDFNKVYKHTILISVDDLSKAPSWVMEVIAREKEGNNKLIDINGYAMKSEDGFIVYEVFALCFASTFSTMNIYKVVKWADMDATVEKVWVCTDELREYLKKIEGVSFYE